jgi:hypothetical protein
VEALKETSAFDLLKYAPQKRLILSFSRFFQDDAIKDLAEFSLANALYAALVEGLNRVLGRSTALKSLLIIFFADRHGQ